MFGNRKSRTFQCKKIVWALVAIVLQVLLLRSATVSGASSSNSQQLPKFPLQGIAKDPFVEASPLVMGVVCADGVLLVAVHTIFSETNEESSLLVSHEDCDGKQNIAGLPKSYRGPFRIHSLGKDTAMVCAGWRTDANLLADHLRSADKSESLVFGPTEDKLSHLADRASLFLARSLVSESRRALSCVGLLASPARLWLVDATGAYAVRAHAVGNGSTLVNKLLRSKANWNELETADAFGELMDLVSGSKDDAMKLLTKGSRFEAAVTKHNGKIEKLLDERIVEL